MSKAAKVKLVWNGHAASNLDVAQETGNGLLEPGRVIHVSPELAELLLRSNAQWEACERECGKAGCRGGCGDPLHESKRKPRAAMPEPNEGADGAKEDES